MSRLFAAVMLLVTMGCVAGTTTTEGVSSPTSVTRPVSWDGFETRQISLDGRQLVVAVASIAEERSKGLGGVTDLTGIDGMLFVFDGLTTARFWMKDTLIDLDIAFFDADGRLVERLTMTPCVEDPCPTYGPTDPYRWALEASAGGVLADVAPESVLVP